MEAVALKPQTKRPMQVAKSTVQTAKKIATTISVGRKEEKSPYNAEFVAKIQQGREDYKAGKGRTVTLEELDSLWK